MDCSLSDGPEHEPQNEVVERLRRDDVVVDDVFMRRTEPVHFGNIDCRGTFSFGIDK